MAVTGISAFHHHSEAVATLRNPSPGGKFDHGWREQMYVLLNYNFTVDLP